MTHSTAIILNAVPLKFSNLRNKTIYNSLFPLALFTGKHWVISFDLPVSADETNRNDILLIINCEEIIARFSYNFNVKFTIKKKIKM